MFWKYAANLQENTYAEVWFQQICFATLLKSHFGMVVLLWICSIFSEQVFLRTPPDGCFWSYFVWSTQIYISIIHWNISLQFQLSVIKKRQQKASVNIEPTKWRYLLIFNYFFHSSFWFLHTAQVSLIYAWNQYFYNIHQTKLFFDEPDCFPQKETNKLI